MIYGRTAPDAQSPNEQETSGRAKEKRQKKYKNENEKKNCLMLNTLFICWFASVPWVKSMKEKHTHIHTQQNIRKGKNKWLWLENMIMFQNFKRLPFMLFTVDTINGSPRKKQEEIIGRSTSFPFLTQINDYDL